jgi:hypothetical protein
MVDSGSANIDAGISRDAAFCPAPDGADATGCDGKSRGPFHLRNDTRRWPGHIETRNPGRSAPGMNRGRTEVVKDYPRYATVESARLGPDIEIDD